MKIRWDPKKQRFPGFHGRFMVDSIRGQLRVRSWPRKRGTPKSLSVRVQNKWFKDANQLAKRCAASQQAQAIRMTLGTGLYPRDLLLKCMAGGIIQPITGDGRLMQRTRRIVEKLIWNGFTLRLTADQNIGIGAFAVVDWPLPYRDTLGFWNVASPGVITIPPGVTMMQIWAQTLSNINWAGIAAVQIRELGGSNWGRSDNGGFTSHGLSVGTGAINVTEGQQFQVRAFEAVNGVLQGTNQNTWFSGTVLESG